MNYEEFVELVGQLREKQREYFRTRSKDVLIEFKRLEKRVDDIVALFAAAKKLDFTNHQTKEQS